MADGCRKKQTRAVAPSPQSDKYEPPEKFIKHFRRDGAGVWVCVELATLDLREGRIQVAPGSRFVIGTKFMNVDLARMLDEEYSRNPLSR